MSVEDKKQLTSQQAHEEYYNYISNYVNDMYDIETVMHYEKHTYRLALQNIFLRDLKAKRINNKKQILPFWVTGQNDDPKTWRRLGTYLDVGFGRYCNGIKSAREHLNLLESNIAGIEADSIAIENAKKIPGSSQMRFFKCDYSIESLIDCIDFIKSIGLNFNGITVRYLLESFNDEDVVKLLNKLLELLSPIKIVNGNKIHTGCMALIIPEYSKNFAYAINQKNLNFTRIGKKDYEWDNGSWYKFLIDNGFDIYNSFKYFQPALISMQDDMIYIRKREN